MKIVFVTSYADADCFWLRVGPLLVQGLSARMPVLFSEREGYRRFWRVRRWRFRVAIERNPVKGRVRQEPSR